MNHPEVRRRMGEYLQGDLPLAQRALFDAHLDGCEACAADLHALRETVHLLRDLPSPEVPPHLADRIVARIEDGEGRARWWDGLAAFWDWIDPARYLPPLAAASLTSAVLIVGVRDYGWQIPGTLPPASVEQADGFVDSGRLEEAPDLRMQPRLRPPGRAVTASDAAEEPARRMRVLGAAPAAPPAAALESAAALELVEEADVIDDPHLFLERYRALQEERRAAWLAQMAERAARGRKVEAVARRLREDAGPEGRALAEQFEAVAYPAGR